MFGCHNCEKKPEPGSNYEKSPCATCRTMRNPPPESHFTVRIRADISGCPSNIRR